MYNNFSQKSKSSQNATRRVDMRNILGTSKRLHIRDRESGKSFLIDTGSDISLLLADSRLKLRPSDHKLYVANNSPINTYGEKRLSLDLGFKDNLVCNFCLTAVPYPILGADFLSYYVLNVDIKKKRLIDPTKNYDTTCEIKLSKITDVSVIDKA